MAGRSEMGRQEARWVVRLAEWVMAHWADE